jgi:hypothetical protein
VAGTAGRYEDEDYSIHRGHHFGQIVVTLPEEKERNFPDNPDNDIELHLEYMRQKLTNYVKGKYTETVQKPFLRVFPKNTGPPVGKPVNIRIQGNSIDQAES